MANEGIFSQLDKMRAKKLQRFLDKFNYVVYENDDVSGYCLNALFNVRQCDSWMDKAHSCMWSKYIECSASKEGGSERFADHVHWYADKNSPWQPIALTLQPYGVDSDSIKRLTDLGRIYDLNVTIGTEESWWHEWCTMIHIAKTPLSHAPVENDEFGVWQMEKMQYEEIVNAIEFSARRIRLFKDVTPLQCGLSMDSEIVYNMTVYELFGAIIGADKLTKAIIEWGEENPKAYESLLEHLAAKDK